jgi:hypothetical protein
MQGTWLVPTVQTPLGRIVYSKGHNREQLDTHIWASPYLSERILPGIARALPFVSLNMRLKLAEGHVSVLDSERTRSTTLLNFISSGLFTLRLFVLSTTRGLTTAFIPSPVAPTGPRIVNGTDKPPHPNSNSAAEWWLAHCLEFPIPILLSLTQLPGQLRRSHLWRLPARHSRATLSQWSDRTIEMAVKVGELCEGNFWEEVCWCEFK